MNSSAKLTALSFLAATAIGAFVFTGCTVSSGTNDDTDGGTQNNKDDSDKDKDAGSTDTPDAEADADADADVCESNQAAPIVSDECQSCLSTSCCSALQACFNIEADSEHVDCNDYADCIADCGDEEGDDRDSCYDACDAAAAPGVADGYKQIETCATDHCAEVCGLAEE